jgi:oligosaccharyltransferase complex subunit delta (ribophorin II)
MRFTQSIAPALLLLASGAAQAASAWGFDEGSVQVVPKTSGQVIKERCATPHQCAPESKDKC